MNDKQQITSSIWDIDQRILQAENVTVAPGNQSDLSPPPAEAPTAFDVFPGSNEESSSVPGESPSAPGAVPGSDIPGPPTASVTETFPPAPAADSFPTAPTESFPSAPVSSGVTLPPSPTSWITDSPGWSPTLPPSSGNGGGGATSPYQNNQFLAFLVILVLGVVGFLCAWKFCKVWRARRERQMLRLQSTRVDGVLGDLELSPQDEYDDDDPELL